MSRFRAIEKGCPATREGYMSSLDDFNHHRPLLFLIAYQMLGTVTELVAAVELKLSSKKH
ncbi:MAG: hypothetical protein HWQ35_15830 [Nostoc sp. NMS1]|uniref:hypothetical protein n=1 Tax=unclassified Nostoc TaxID=2593658 RepID=UPI0025D77630|nr:MULTISPECIES: hypothetical protein [unclassified Nostoc]MBN3907966.1 hypothetical protein [Nostoc sp. NMS1]MBN3989444.1 hypothetical protein [Nostoc sp. NMS2]